MKRYEEDGQEGYFEDEDVMDESQEESVEATIDLQGNLLEVMQLELAELSLNQDLLNTAVDIAQKDIWWRFRKPSKKVKRVEKIYKKLINIARESKEE